MGATQQLLSGGGRLYATLDPAYIGTGLTLSNGNLTVTHTGTIDWRSVRSTIGKSSGKWYWEVTIGTTGANYIMLGDGMGFSTANYHTISTTGQGYYGLDGTKWYNNSGAAFGATYTAGDVIGIALDATSGALEGSIECFKNNVSQGTIDYLGSGPYYAALSLYNQNDYVTANFGASAFTYSPPSGYNAGLYS